MKYFFLLILSFQIQASNPVLTPPSKANSGCNVKDHLGLKDRKDFLKFHDLLVQLVKKDDIDSIASLINYPLKLNLKRKTKVTSKNQFKTMYNSIFTKKIKGIILNQNRNGFFCKSTGLMYASGQIWVNNFNKKKELRIITIGL